MLPDNVKMVTLLQSMSDSCVHDVHQAEQESDADNDDYCSDIVITNVWSLCACPDDVMRGTYSDVCLTNVNT